MSDSKRKRSWFQTFQGAWATFTIGPGRPSRPLPEALSTPRKTSNLDGFRRDREALANDWRRVGQDIRNAADKILSPGK